MNGGLLFLDALFDTPQDAAKYQAQVITSWICKKIGGIGCYWTLSGDELIPLLYKEETHKPPYMFYVVFADE